METTYISTGYKNWKQVTSRFPLHESSRCNRDAVLKMATLPATTRDISKSLTAITEMKSNATDSAFLWILSYYRGKDYHLMAVG